jgi:predicted nuclease of predicted toxin-antitoxin system
VRYLADHHISPRTVAPLTQKGFDIYRVSDVLPSDAKDFQILELARAEGRAVITQDLDCSALLASTGYNRPSVVCLRLHNNRPGRLTAVLEKILPAIETDLQTGAILIIEGGSSYSRPPSSLAVRFVLGV